MIKNKTCLEYKDENGITQRLWIDVEKIAGISEPVMDHHNVASFTIHFQSKEIQVNTKSRTKYDHSGALVDVMSDYDVSMPEGMYRMWKAFREVFDKWVG